MMLSMVSLASHFNVMALPVGVRTVMFMDATLIRTDATIHVGSNGLFGPKTDSNFQSHVVNVGCGHAGCVCECS